MDVNSLINKFLGSSAPSAQSSSNLQGLAGGAVAGGLISLLMTNKSARKVAGGAAQLGGMALLGGLAYKAYSNWQSNNSPGSAEPIKVTEDNAAVLPQTFSDTTAGESLALTLVKAMIAAAKADGHIDATEQKKIFERMQSENLSQQEKALIFDLLTRSVAIEEIASGVNSLEHKSEVYLASYLVCGADSADERKYLAALAEGLSLPQDLVFHLDKQAAALQS